MADKVIGLQFKLSGVKEGAQDVNKLKEAVKDMNSAVKGLGFKDIDSAFKQSPKLAGGIAKGLGLEVKQGIEKGLESAASGSKTKSLLAQFSHTIGGRGVRTLAGGLGASAETSATIGGIFGVLGTLRLAFWELTPVLAVFKGAINMATEAFKRGSDLYVKAAQLRVNASDLYRVRKASDATGLPEGEADRILLMMRAGRAGSGRGGDSLKDKGQFMQVSALKEVFADVFNQLDRAGDVMERTAGEFYNVILASKMLNTEFEVTGTLLGEYVSGAVHSFIEDMKGFLETLNAGDVISGLSRELGAVLMVIQKTIAIFSLAIQGFATGIQLIADSLTWLIVKLNNLVAKIPGAGKLGITHIDASNSQIFKGSIAMATKTREAADRFSNFNLKAPDRKAPNAPLTGYSIPHMGMWEKLGLSFGSGGSLDYAKQTAENTKRMAAAMTQFVERHTPSTAIRPRNILNHA